MSNKHASYSQIVQVQQRSIQSLTEISKAKYLPQDLKDALDSVTQLFKNYNVEQFREPMKKLIGEQLTVQQLSDILIKASESTKWKVEEYNDDADIDFFRNSLNLDVQESDAKKFTASRKTSNKQDVGFLIFTCLPGHVFVELQTNNVGYSSEKVIANNNLSSYLYGQI